MGFKYIYIYVYKCSKGRTLSPYMKKKDRAPISCVALLPSYTPHTAHIACTHKCYRDAQKRTHIFARESHIQMNTPPSA